MVQLIWLREMRGSRLPGVAIIGEGCPETWPLAFTATIQDDGPCSRGSSPPCGHKEKRH